MLSITNPTHQGTLPISQSRTFEETLQNSQHHPMTPYITPSQQTTTTTFLITYTMILSTTNTQKDVKKAMNPPHAPFEITFALPLHCAACISAVETAVSSVPGKPYSAPIPSDHLTHLRQESNLQAQP